jgi:hypothetical protein
MFITLLLDSVCESRCRRNERSGKEHGATKPLVATKWLSALDTKGVYGERRVDGEHLIYELDSG